MGFLCSCFVRKWLNPFVYLVVLGLINLNDDILCFAERFFSSDFMFLIATTSTSIVYPMN